MKKYVLLWILLQVSNYLFAQGLKERVENKNTGLSASFSVSDSSKKHKLKFTPVPKKAAIFAAIFPSGGQIYNRDYWKVPLVLAALAGGTWTAIYWRVRYKDFLAGYLSFHDFSHTDSSSYGQLKDGLNADSKLPVFYRGGILNGERNAARLYNINQVQKVKDEYRRYFETSVVVTAAIYVLAIIEANVAAHLKTFDISDDISFRVEPKMSQPLVKQPVPGIRLVFSFH
ncbi:DUF5683 domain-containing protein [Dyadobacter sp. CY356]|uniref:DUF5683 domain-containing protein n=1 Tax=Dyadobacter sp. CY356 TaxID=2906442 RepID=UPI001F18F4A5|nr:DUF5683 domain-containing protein [Dyadobacter sp. CY356]MCF0054644.1 DUF5683 domain-containing protein [Dyadobacter sp. CY356]